MKALATKKLLAAAMAAAMTIGACSMAGAFEVTVPEGVELTEEEITLRFWDIWPEGQPMAPIVQNFSFFCVGGGARNTNV